MAIFVRQEFMLSLLIHMARETGYENIISDLKNKIYYPVYLLFGEEPYFIDLISDFIEGNILSRQ